MFQGKQLAKLLLNNDFWRSLGLATGYVNDSRQPVFRGLGTFGGFRELFTRYRPVLE